MIADRLRDGFAGPASSRRNGDVRQGGGLDVLPMLLKGSEGVEYAAREDWSNSAWV